ncbi:MAG TPA: hypothetical protein VLW85_20520 [Myxococcales bacterium]|nr:hypothetical protein [Myxococcales bacterium]
MTAALAALLLAAPAADAKLLDAAHAYVARSSAPGVTFDLQVGAIRKNWALLRTTNAKGANGEALDDALVYMRRTKGRWQGAIMGTAITDDDLKQLGAPKLRPVWPTGTPCYPPQ